MNRYDPDMEDQTKNIKPLDKLGINLLFLAIAVFLINIWANHHLNINGKSLVLINIIPAIYGILTFLMSFGSDDEVKSLRRKMRPVLFFFLKPGVLTIIYLVFFSCGSTISSVTILADGMDEHIEISIIPEGLENPKQSRIINSPYDIAKMVLFTSPFGKSFYVNADGFIRESFELYPWIGKRIRLTKDLRPTPTLLFRLPGPSIRRYDGGKFKILTKDDTISSRKINSQQSSSIMLGKYRRIGQEYKDDWNVSLLIDEVENPKRASILRAWGNPIVLDSINLYPGESVQVLFFNNSNLLKSSADIVVLDDAFQDVLLNSL